MPEPTGLFVGFTACDQIFVVDTFPEENKKQRATSYFLQSGGNALNAGLAFSLLGGAGVCYSCLGGSSWASHIRNECRSLGLDFIDCAPENYELATSSLIISADTGHRTIISTPKNDDLVANIPPILPENFDFILIDGFFRNLVTHIIPKAKDIGAPIIMDADKWRTDNYEEFIGDVDIPIFSEEFLPPGCHTPEDVFAYFQQRGMTEMALSRGEKPILANMNGVFYEVPVPRIQAVDTLCAGDILHGAFAYYYIQTGRDFLKSLEQAAKVASHSCTTLGRAWMDDYRAPKPASLLDIAKS
ncbi:MAG: hypothetical protein H6855_07265 [Rhodospirillales bacterium]|nr:hypothetical protein [Rhodospirillales bacterium]MCB9965859.1 hypothetical protein [Rhodospirillales bacterium]MCB9973380.1 hypothetical protein [Rhodospirillales bacterium]